MRTVFSVSLGPRIGLLENAETLGGPQQLDLEFFGSVLRRSTRRLA